MFKKLTQIRLSLFKTVKNKSYKYGEQIQKWGRQAILGHKIFHLTYSNVWLY